MKAVKNADARYIDYRTVWVGPDRSVESSFVFYFIIIMKKSKTAKTPTPVIDYIEWVVLCCVVVSRPFSRKFFRVYLLLLL
jgi:hypothetical protein